MEKEKSMTIVICSKGYPRNYVKKKLLAIFKMLNEVKEILFIMQVQN